MENQLIVAVWMVTYNQDEFIEESILSVMMQESTFKYKLFIGEDNSTDKTREICLSLKDKYPDKIELSLHEKNIGANLNGNYMYKKCIDSGAKYIALCEGDDYWTDPYKLQKQVDFLEVNTDYGLCFTKTNYLKNNVLELQELPFYRPEGVYELKDLYFYHNFINTASVLIKRFEMPNWFNNLPYGDLAVYSIVAKNQKIKCLDLVGSVYRIHDNGLWQGKSRRNQVLMGLKFNKKIYSHVDSEIQKIIKLKSIVLMEELIKIEYKNRFFRGVYFRYLKYIYFPN